MLSQNVLTVQGCLLWGHGQILAFALLNMQEASGHPMDCLTTAKGSIVTVVPPNHEMVRTAAGRRERLSRYAAEECYPRRMEVRYWARQL